MHAVGRQLTLTNDTEFPAVYNIGIARSNLDRVVGYAFHGGIGGVGLHPVGAPTLDGRAWSGRAQSPFGLNIAVEGVWDPALESFVTTVVSFRTAGAKGASGRRTLEEHATFAGVDIPIPRRIVWFENNRTIEEIRISEFTFVNRASLRERTRIPAPGDGSQVLDFRERASEAWAMYAHVPRARRISSGVFELIEPDVPAAVPIEHNGHQRTVGYWAIGVAGIVAVAIVVIWARRRLA